jgi:hypothetical protein
VSWVGAERPATLRRTGNPLEVLQRIRQAPPRSDPGERCDLCRTEIGDEHAHIVDLEGRGMLCACRPCWLLFSSEGAGGGHFRAVPDRVLRVTGFALSPGQWDALQIPVRVAFFFRNSALDRVAAFYPSPAGATESLLALEAWDEVVTANPALATQAADVEAVLVDAGGGSPRCYIVPIDVCYELVGVLRRCWRGFDGGEDARRALRDFFAGIDARAKPVPAGGGG